jgi:transcriptional regulator with XRE-family HTH domain
MRRFSRKEFTQFGLTVSKFCRRFEISAPTISKMERGDPSVSDVTWARLERALMALNAEMQQPAKPYRASASRA